MATHDYVISNASGAAVRADLNNALAAIVSNNSNATEPSTTYSYMLWADTGSSPPVMKLRNAANDGWVTLFQLDGEWTSIAFEDGTAAAPSIYFKDSGTDTGFFSGGTDQVNVTTGGVERVEWGASEVVFNDGGENYDFRIEGDTDSALFFVDASADAVGIGTTAPNAKLVVSNGGAEGIEFSPGYASNTSSILAYNRTTSAHTEFGIEASQIPFRIGGSEKARIDSSGRLLVGTSTSLLSYANFQMIGGAGGATSANIYLGSTDASIPSGSDLGSVRFGNNAGNLAATIVAQSDGTWSGAGGSDYPGRLVFSTTADGASSPTERVRIARDGASKFFSSANTTTIRAGNASSSGTSHRLFYGLHSATNVTDGTAIYSIFTNGTVGTPSDIRLKKNVESTRDGYLDDVANLRVVKYHWKTQDDSEPKELGLIAQEVEQIFPGLIRTEGEGENETKELKRSVIPFILLKALQEANEKIEAQQQIIEDLLARVTALEAQ